jgi:hypothetical protein
MWRGLATALAHASLQGRSKKITPIEPPINRWRRLPDSRQFVESAPATAW